MNDDSRSGRSPFGERDEDERSQPFGVRPSRRTPDKPDILPTTPYPDLRQKSREYTPPQEPDERIEDLPQEPFEEELPPPEPSPAPEPAARSSYAVLPEVRVGRGVVIDEQTALLKGHRPAQEAPADDTLVPSAETDTQVVIRFGVLLRSIAVIFATSAVIATLFTWWTPNTFLPRASVNTLSVALATQSGPAAIPTISPPTATPIPPMNNIGIVSGHRGILPSTGLPDPGAVCDDGLTEREVNESVATRVATLLEGHGYQVDLLDEFDERLNSYQALAIVSIHADSCQYINDQATGFKVASFSESSAPEADALLVDCLTSEYADTTGLGFHPSVTFDMTRYHTFREVTPGTPGAIIEIGFMYLDRQLLTETPDVVALGVARGILCFVRGGDTSTAEPTLAP